MDALTLLFSLGFTLGMGSPGKGLVMRAVEV